RLLRGVGARGGRAEPAGHLLTPPAGERTAAVAGAEVLATPAGLLGLGALPVDEVDRELVDEPGRRVVRRRSPGRAHDRPGDVEPLAGTGQPDVGKPALFLQLRL